MLIRLTRFLTALLLALAMLFAIPLSVLAESPEKKENADIEETLVSGEGEKPGSLAQDLHMFRQLLEDEDVKAILKNQEVGEITSEIFARILVWMLHNRSVTMEILAEFGINQSDRQSIEKIWDSADRIIAAYQDYLDTEDGKQLTAEFEAVKNDPDVIESMKDFRALVTSEDLNQLLQALSNAVEADKTNDETENGKLTQAVMEREINDKSFVGSLILEIMQIMDQSAWAQKSIPKLMKNENVMALLLHLANGNPELDQLIQTELSLILGDQEINLFIQNILRNGHALFKALDGSSAQAAEPETKEPENTVEEVVP